MLCMNMWTCVVHLCIRGIRERKTEYKEFCRPNATGDL